MTGSKNSPFLNMELSQLKYVSEKREKDFNKLNIYTAEELLRHFPRDYLDLTHVEPLRNAYHNDVILTLCEVLNVEYNRYSRRPYVKALCRQGDYLFSAVWFNQPYVVSKLKIGKYLFYGRVQNKYGMGASMVNPAFESAEENAKLKGLIPVYPLAGSLTQGAVRSAIKQALSKVILISKVPIALRRKYALMPLEEAYEKLHLPQTQNDIKSASERIAIEEYFLLISAFKIIKGDGETARLNRYTVTADEVKEFTSRFPFDFTEGQKEAINDVFRDVHSPRVMNRLIQGDVGCGKTAVAITGIFMAVKSGYQAALLAPTEVLARQNAEVIKKYLPEYNVQFLSGSTPAAEKREIKRGLSEGSVNVVCGTHAVIQGDVNFKNLAFVVCDEQHRFGVAQRSSITQKGEGCDALVMSATPIPRTLSLIFYGDLDVTTIKDKPVSRREISTSVIPERKYGDMYNYIANQVKAGSQAYLVCPKIEGDEEGSAMSVTELYEELSAKLPSVRFALLHGKMKDKQKNEVMQAFKSREYDCLVSTTVIEVGVDVPNATIMVIYNAERFGLSQLHQLRGRVGRGDRQSYCFLLMGNDTPAARERLAVIKNNSDGFAIAESDLQTRGGGDFMGTRQSGRVMSELNNLRFPVSAIFTAKAISDEAFSGAYDVTEVRRAALGKYEKLKDVIMN
ncbi:MAG: ATP-dependent DNA helicase RecG [Candidatus Coproplasma sp.]